MLGEVGGVTIHPTDIGRQASPYPDPHSSEGLTYNKHKNMATRTTDAHAKLCTLEYMNALIT